MKPSTCTRRARCRVVIEGVEPEIDAGRFPIKRVVGERVVVEADVFADGHDELACVLRYREAEAVAWCEVHMTPLVNDRWRGEFRVGRPGRYLYTIEAWVDHFHTWARDLLRRVEAGQEVSVDLQIGAALVAEAAERASGDDARALRRAAEELVEGRGAAVALSAELAALMRRYPDRRFATRYDRELEVVVGRERARFSAWYEMFPRSASPEPGRHGTLADVEARLPYIAEMGFDVLYLPPIHPIGRSFRKGPNNRPGAGAGDPGSPWAIGGPEGGHRAVHPELGTLEDFRRLVRAARRHGLEIAMDLAFQASPDHPYVREHPEWFRARPDGSIQYAENPPKKYQDIYPFDFGCSRWRELWRELYGVVEFWMDQGVRIFRVDNPHTKPFAFWEWLICQARRRDPEVIFLSEAFTRPRVMYRLAKLGFDQSYTYFAWRNEAWELRQYFTELTRTEVREYFRPNLWPNTPDILTEFLQQGGRPASAIRLVLAATLGASYGIYGPAFELVDVRPLEPGREEYLDSEKYQVRHWDLDRPGSLRPLIACINRIRREHPALQQDRTLRFLRTDNERLLAYAKTDEDGSDVIVTVVNLDWRWKQSGWVEVPVVQELDRATYEVRDLLSGASYTWRADGWNYVELDPASAPAHVLQVSRRLAEEAAEVR
ncbi:MAG TPA: alpha-1,4-glucan--maltose-1-phosphate maltosyltransferase [Candidatus Dormibacteraeota bacterium]|nr:alpha-1,4-glucan--maltose-1-phosphate maltosyltransferase [Candidatus Dormibacteraeota bacterium]